jgi:hypothetical protein
VELCRHIMLQASQYLPILQALDWRLPSDVNFFDYNTDIPRGVQHWL